jgi:outer membrane protein TolC
MIRMRTRARLALLVIGMTLFPGAASAQIEERLSALDAVLPTLYDGQPVTLSECLEVGEVASMDLAGLQEDVGVAETDKTAAWMQWLPTLDLSANWRKGEQKQIDYVQEVLVDRGPPPVFDLVIGDRTDRFRTDSQSLNANWTLFNGFDRIYQGKQADADLKSTESNYEYQRRLMRERISDAYYDLQRAYARVEVAQDAEGLAAQELERTETYFELGISTKSDVLQAKVRHQQTKLDVVRENTGERRAFILLAYAMNIPGADPFRVRKELPVVDRVEVRTLDDLIEQASQQRLDLTAAEFNVDAQNAGVNRARSSFYPQLSMFGSASRNFSDLPPDLRFGAELSYSWVYGFQASWSLFNGWQRMQQYRGAVAQRRKAEYALRQTRLEVELQVVNIYSNLIDAVESYDVSSFTVEQSVEDLRLAEERFRVGAGTQLDVITAQVNLATARRDLVDAQVNYAKFLNQMRRAIGGDVVALH